MVSEFLKFLFFFRGAYAYVYLGSVVFEETIRIKAQKFHYHPDYHHSVADTVLPNNIGLVILPENVTVSDTINTIELSYNNVEGDEELTVS